MTEFMLNVELRARKIDCVYIPHDDKKSKQKMTHKNKEKIEKILALKMLEQQNYSDGLEPPEGEVVLAHGQVLISLQEEMGPEWT